MLFNWFNAKDVVIFAQEVAGELVVLLADGSHTGKSELRKKDIKHFDQLILRVRNFAQQQPLNIYKKAKFLNTVKWQLKDSDHDSELIDELIKLLAAAISV
jgi:hypothetical protein